MYIVNLNKLYTYDDYAYGVRQLCRCYPRYLSFDVIGKTNDSHEILMLQMGKGEQTILCTGCVHGREGTNAIVMLAMLEQYAKWFTGECSCSYGRFPSGLSYEEFFMQYQLLFIPMVNPDGYSIANFGFNAINNRFLREDARRLCIPYEHWKANARGVDINRNFPCKEWKAKFPKDKNGSEMETKALMKVMNEHRHIAYYDFHSRGKEIYYYRKQMGEEYNRRQLELAQKMEDSTGYHLVDPEREIEQGDTGGNTVHYFSESIQKPAFTIETVPEYVHFPIPIRHQATTLHEILYVPFTCVD